MDLDLRPLRKAYRALAKVVGKQYELPNTPENAAALKVLNAAGRLLEAEDRARCLLEQRRSGVEP